MRVWINNGFFYFDKKIEYTSSDNLFFPITGISILLQGPPFDLPAEAFVLWARWFPVSERQ